MEICRSIVICITTVSIFLVSTKATVTIESPNLGNVALTQRNLTLKCTVDPVEFAVSWLTPGTSGTTCICQIDGSCRPITQDQRYTCSSDLNGVDVFHMHLTNVEAKDEGTYTCRHATYPNEEGGILIVVQDPVPISKVDLTSPTTSPVIVTENVASTFMCVTSAGRPQAVIQWYKRLGSPVAISGGSHSILPNGSLVVTTSTLQYKSTRDDHGYRIFCTAYNIDMASKFTSTNQIQLFVQYAPDTPAIIEGHTDKSILYILDARPQTLTCSIQGGRPLATLTWNCFNGSTQNKSTADTVTKVITWMASAAHNGQRCICESSHIIWQSTRQVYLAIETLYAPTPPTVTVLKQSISGSVSVIRGRNVTVRCSSTGNPSPSYAWTPRGSSTSSDNILTLTNVTASDKGAYTCTATNTMVPTQGNPKNGTSNLTISLKVLYPPTTPALTLLGQNVSGSLNVIEGRDVTVRCNSTGNPSPQYAWSPRGSSSFSDTLTLTNITTRVQANYTCTASNIMSPTQGNPVNATSHATVFLNVLYAPGSPAVIEDHANGSSLYIIDGKPQTLACSVPRGNPLPTLAWRCFNGSVLNRSSGDTVASEIKWTASTRHDGQRCICESSHTLWSSTRTVVVRVEALYAPSTPTLTVDNQPVSGTITVIAGRNLTIRCNSSSNPSPSYTWTHRGVSTPSSALNLRKVTASSQGDYTCTVNNTMVPSQGDAENGSHSVTLDLTVLYPPSTPLLSIEANTVSGQINVIENRSVSVLCSSSANPSPGYTWTPRGSSTSADNTLTLADIKINNRGDYKCMVTNTMIPTFGSSEKGSSNVTMFLNVLYPPRHVVLRYGNISGPTVTNTLDVIKGDTFNIYCSADANPFPMHHWTSQTMNNTILSVTGIQLRQSWSCNVSNLMTPTIAGTEGPSKATTKDATAEPGFATATFTADVLYGPSAPTLKYYNNSNSTSQIPTGVVSIIEGTPFTVVCDGSDSKPASGYSWSGDITSQTGTLTLNNVGPDDDNTISNCTASNVMKRSYGATEIGKNTTVLNIRVLYAPRVIAIADDTAIENHDFFKTCNYSPGNPSTTDVEWTTPDGATISDPQLTISNVSKSDSGKYTCTAQNTMTPTFGNAEDGITSEAFELSVYYPASILTFSINGESEKGSLTYDESSSITVHCEIDSNPGSLITLSRDDVDLATFQSAKVANHVVRNATCLDAGNYSCVAQNDYNDGEIPRTFSLIFIRCPPRSFDTVNNLTYYVSLKNSVMLELTFTAYPAPDTYTWYKYHSESNWTQIEEGTSFTSQNTSLNIADLKQADYGQYKVVVVNSIGTLEHMFFIAARGKPETPMQIAVKPHHSYVIVQWTPGFNGGYTQRFYIEYRKVADRAWTVVNAGDEASEVFNQTVGNIVPSTDYVIRMYSKNEIDKSDVSEEVQFKSLDSRDSASSENPLAAIVGGIMAALAVIIIVVVATLVRKRFISLKDCGRHTQHQCTDECGNHTTSRRRRNEHVYEDLRFDPASTQIEEAACGQPLEDERHTTQAEKTDSEKNGTDSQENATETGQRGDYEDLVSELRQKLEPYEDLNSKGASTQIEEAACGGDYETLVSELRQKLGSYEDLSSKRGTDTGSRESQVYINMDIRN